MFLGNISTTIFVKMPNNLGLTLFFLFVFLHFGRRNPLYYMELQFTRLTLHSHWYNTDTLIQSGVNVQYFYCPLTWNCMMHFVWSLNTCWKKNAFLWNWKEQDTPSVALYIQLNTKDQRGRTKLKGQQHYKVFWVKFNLHTFSFCHCRFHVCFSNTTAL